MTQLQNSSKIQKTSHLPNEIACFEQEKNSQPLTISPHGIISRLWISCSIYAITSAIKLLDQKKERRKLSIHWNKNTLKSRIIIIIWMQDNVAEWIRVYLFIDKKKLTRKQWTKFDCYPKMKVFYYSISVKCAGWCPLLLSPIWILFAVAFCCISCAFLVNPIYQPLAGQIPEFARWCWLWKTNEDRYANEFIIYYADERPFISSIQLMHFFSALHAVKLQQQQQWW